MSTPDQGKNEIEMRLYLDGPTLAKIKEASEDILFALRQSGEPHAARPVFTVDYVISPGQHDLYAQMQRITRDDFNGSVSVLTPAECNALSDEKRHAYSELLHFFSSILPDRLIGELGLGSPLSISWDVAKLELSVSAGVEQQVLASERDEQTTPVALGWSDARLKEAWDEIKAHTEGNPICLTVKIGKHGPELSRDDIPEHERPHWRKEISSPVVFLAEHFLSDGAAAPAKGRECFVRMQFDFKAATLKANAKVFAIENNTLTHSVPGAPYGLVWKDELPQMKV